MYNLNLLAAIYTRSAYFLILLHVLFSVLSGQQDIYNTAELVVSFSG